MYQPYKTLGFNDNQERVTLYAVPYRQDVFKYTTVQNESICNGWERGVHQCYTQCAKVLGRFPDTTYKIGETVITSFKTYTDELGSLTKCNSTFLSKRSTSTLEAISLLSKLGKSSSYLLFQFGKVLPKVSSAFRNIVTNLSGSIGELVQPVNEVISEVERSLNKILKQFQNRFVEQKQERCEKIDFEESIKCAQLLTNTIALIAETALSDSDCITFANEAYEAISILTFILNLYLIAVQGSNANIATVQLSESKNISPFLNSCFKSMDPLIGGIAKAMTSITFDVAKSMREFLSSFVDLTHSLNESLYELFGPFEGATITVAQIKKNLVRSQGN